MKKLILSVVGLMMTLGSFSYETWKDPKTGIEWGYQIVGDEVSVGGEDCSAVSSATFGELSIPPDILGRKVTRVGSGAFRGCDLIKSVTVPNGVAIIGAEAFKDCSSLTSINLSQSVTNVGAFAFYGCRELTSIVIPIGVKSLEWSTFQGCDSLTRVEIPSGVTNIGSMVFQGCKNLIDVVMPGGVKDIGDDAFEGCSSLTNILLPEGVANIGNHAFAGCRSLRRIMVPESVTNVGHSSFARCEKLEQATLSTNIKHIPCGVFEGCESLNAIDLPRGVTNIGSVAFGWCRKLKSVFIPPHVVRIGGWAFRDCIEMKDVNVPHSVNEIGRSAFEGCVGLGDGMVIRDGCVLTVNGNCPSSVVLPEGVRLIAGGAFSGCELMESITIPGSVKDIGACAFNGCVGLGEGVVIRDGCVLTVNGNCPSSVILPEGVRLIAGGAFSYCEKLIDTTLPEGLVRIGEEAFANCYNLKAVTLPSSVRSIGTDAFSHNCALKFFLVKDEKGAAVRSLLSSVDERPVYVGTYESVTGRLETAVAALDAKQRWSCEEVDGKVVIYRTVDERSDKVQQCANKQLGGVEIISILGLCVIAVVLILSLKRVLDKEARREGGDGESVCEANTHSDSKELGIVEDMVCRNGNVVPTQVQGDDGTRALAHANEEKIVPPVIQCATEEMAFCGMCGKKISSTSRFCSFCGEPTSFKTTSPQDAVDVIAPQVAERKKTITIYGNKEWNALNRPVRILHRGIEIGAVRGGEKMVLDVNEDMILDFEAGTLPVLTFQYCVSAANPIDLQISYSVPRQHLAVFGVTDARSMQEQLVRKDTAALIWWVVGFVGTVLIIFLIWIHDLQNGVFQ